MNKVAIDSQSVSQSSQVETFDTYAQVFLRCGRVVEASYQFVSSRVIAMSCMPTAWQATKATPKRAVNPSVVELRRWQVSTIGCFAMTRMIALKLIQARGAGLTLAQQKHAELWTGIARVTLIVRVGVLAKAEVEGFDDGSVQRIDTRQRGMMVFFVSFFRAVNACMS